MVEHIPALCLPIASISRRLPTTEKNPEINPQVIVVCQLDPRSPGRKSEVAAHAAPITRTKSPRERGLRAKSLKTKSFIAEQNIQQKA